MTNDQQYKLTHDLLYTCVPFVGVSLALGEAVAMVGQRRRREERMMEAQDGGAVDVSRCSGGRTASFTNEGEPLRLC